MLEDRNYMRRPTENKYLSGMRCVYTLIAINVLAFLMFNAQMKYDLWLSWGGIRDGMFWQPLSAMFMHAGFSHLFFNMFSLYIFGGIVAPRLGGRSFLGLYLASGLLGNFLWLVCSMDSPAILCGASGAVMGVLSAAAVMAPEIPMLILFIPFPVKLRTMAIVFFAIDVVMQLSGGQSGVAYLAHIGGFLTGYLFLRVFFRGVISWDPLASLFSNRRPSGFSRSNPSSGWTYHRTGGDSRRNPYAGQDYGPNFSAGPDAGRETSGRVTQKELDFLLDKISRSSINSLTEEELQRLRQAREQMRNS